MIKKLTFTVKTIGCPVTNLLTVKMSTKTHINGKDNFFLVTNLLTIKMSTKTHVYGEDNILLGDKLSNNKNVNKHSP